MKILAVDDDPSILEVLEAALSSLDNHEVVTAMSAVEGLEILAEDPEPYDAMLVDIQMPEMNGIEMCQNIRQFAQYRDTPIIVVTAMSQRTYISDAFRAGATDYVTKPFDLIDLRTRVASATRQSRHNAGRRNRAAKADVADPIQVRNVTRILGQDEYENYVMQISQSLTSKSSIVGIKIVDIEALHDKLETAVFEKVIELVAMAISVLTRQEGHVISYRGNGVFLCIRIGRYDVLPSSFETLVNRHIHSALPGELARHKVRVCVGGTTVLKASTKAGALDALNDAVASVEDKAQTLASLPAVSTRVLSNQSRSAEEERVERRVYSLMLQDMLTEQGPPVRQR